MAGPYIGPPKPSKRPFCVMSTWRSALWIQLIFPGSQHSAWEPDRSALRLARPSAGQAMTWAIVSSADRRTAPPARRLLRTIRFPHGLEDSFDRRLENQELLGHCPAIQQHRQFTSVPIDHLHLHARLLPQCVRHTGGMRSGPASRRTFPDRYLLHSSSSFCISRHRLATLILAQMAYLIVTVTQVDIGESLGGNRFLPDRTQVITASQDLLGGLESRV